MSNLNDVYDWAIYKQVLEKLLENIGGSKDFLNCRTIENTYHIKGKNRNQIIEQYKDNYMVLILCLYYFACEDLRDKTNEGIPKRKDMP